MLTHRVPMIRQFIRALVVTVSVSLLALALVAQSRGAQVQVGRLHVSSQASNLVLSTRDSVPFEVAAFDTSNDRTGYFTLPQAGHLGTISFLFLPWWLVMVIWGIVGAPAWLLVRERKVKRGFDVEERLGRDGRGGAENRP